jgi:hypothetical protein
VGILLECSIRQSPALGPSLVKEENCILDTFLLRSLLEVDYLHMIRNIVANIRDKQLAPED